ncbi:Hypothetical Protein FCC1311_028362 [Hondaea fermentalgiana]|uniref:Uncharacterized protein n=1 Tax=Hondaea fermentalgiana TaxID=2315210 RepID=A0A2R5G7U7_9STRA|nr:Hypothetical Protein FCC1311_028362 [Hondaea fermentalgiana]|eukprot:GBG26615.1 Hypothetical Protein FCC1311_028362 [Hondaea fermentalgiana]
MGVMTDLHESLPDDGEDTWLARLRRNLAQAEGHEPGHEPCLDRKKHRGAHPAPPCSHSGGSWAPERCEPSCELADVGACSGRREEAEAAACGRYLDEEQKVDEDGLARGDQAMRPPGSGRERPVRRPRVLRQSSPCFQTQSPLQAAPQNSQPSRLELDVRAAVRSGVSLSALHRDLRELLAM